MLPIYLALSVALAAVSPVHAQEAVPREAVQAADPAPEPVRQAIPRGSRPQGNNPQVGTAVPRGAVPRPAAPPVGGPRVVSRSRGRTVIVRPPVVYGYPYRPYSLYPYYSPYPSYGAYRRYYPYGYGAFGLGSLYYDQYRWHPGAHVSYYGSYSGSYSGYSRPFSTFDIGELRLDVSPRHAQVFVDGYYAGIVDDFDGAFQAIKLAPGAYRIEIVAPGYETLAFDVQITPGQKIRYRGDLARP